MLAPSKATPRGPRPTLKVPSTAPSVARSLVTLLLPLFTTQMLAPSKANSKGPLPAGKVPRVAPLLESFVTLLLPEFATQILCPSKATPTGRLPTPKVPIEDLKRYEKIYRYCPAFAETEI